MKNLTTENDCRSPLLIENDDRFNKLYEKRAPLGSRDDNATATEETTDMMKSVALTDSNEDSLVI